MIEQQNRKRNTTILSYLVICIIIILYIFPIYWMFVSSFRDNSMILSFPPKLFPTGGGLENYRKILSDNNFIQYFKNSAFVSLAVVVISTAMSMTAGYAFSRYKFRFKETLSTMILSIQIFPITVIIISLYTIYVNLNLLNTHFGLIIANTLYTLPFSVWFLKSYFDTIPTSIDESASIDGCGRFRTMYEIIVPLIKPGIIAVVIYSFLKSWDEYVFARTLITKDALRTVPAGIALSFLGEFGDDYAGLMTVSVIAAAPVIIVFIFLQKYMVSGLTSGAIKG